VWYGLEAGFAAEIHPELSMSKRCITAPGAPPALGPYSHAVSAGNFLYLSGQIALRADGSGLARGSIEEETHQVFSNIQAVLKGSGASLQDVVKVVAFLDNIGDFSAFNKVYAQYFPQDPPARSCIQAGKLPAGAKVEIEAIAYVGGR
jgi:2-iminobutanoate/2-iminopropanoate deaminase